MADMTKVAYLFPGQGAQFVGMGKDVYALNSAARRIFDEASEAIDFDVAALCFEDAQEQLQETEYTQPALLATSVAYWAAWNERVPAPVRPDYLIGLSLGEYSALVVSKSISFADAIRVVHIRGRAMQEAVPLGVGGMAAIIDIDADKVIQICREVTTDEAWVEVANFNSPGQVVISGHRLAVRQACQRLKEAGARKTVPLPVSAPFHSRLLQSASDVLASALANVSFADPTSKVVSNVTARPFESIHEIPRRLIQQVSCAVKLEQSIRYVIAQGVDRFYEFGPGTSMAKFVQAVNPESVVWSVNDVAALEAASVALS